MKKRLFIFAAYDKDGLVDDTLVHYLKQIGAHGDIIVVMDNNAMRTEINKLKSVDGVIYASARKHGEYDFGSYKRGFGWAKRTKILGKYKYVYLVNDSCYAIGDLSDIIKKSEDLHADVTGLQEKTNPPHIQSFWVCMRKSIFMSDWFDGFIKSVTVQSNKNDIVRKYEYGFAELLAKHKKTIAGVIVGTKSVFFERPLDVIRQYNIPLVKKHPWSIGSRHYSKRIIKKILGNLAPDMQSAIISNAIRNKNMFDPEYIEQKYVEVRHVAPFVTIVRKSKHPEHRWLMLFGRLQITKIK